MSLWAGIVIFAIGAAYLLALMLAGAAKQGDELPPEEWEN